MNNFIIYNLEEQNGNTRAIDNNTILQWAKEERNGRKIVICTDKNMEYIKGMLSVLSDVNPIVIAENGAVVLWDTFQKKHIMSVDEETKEILSDLRRKIELEFSKVWFQENVIGFVAYCDEIKLIKEYLDKMVIKNVNAMWKENAVSIMPINVDFSNAIKWIGKNIG